MKGNYRVYDDLYRRAQVSGSSGWGGDGRIALGANQLEQILNGPGVPATGRVLELGCGEGHLCRLFADKGYTVTGADVSHVAIEWAKSKQGQAHVRYLQADLSQDGVMAGESFDLVVDGNCLHCIIGTDRQSFLRNVRRMLAERGVLFVSSLCRKHSGPTVIVDLEGQPYRCVPSPETMVQELRAAGFAVLSCQPQERDSEFNHLRVFASGA